MSCSSGSELHSLPFLNSSPLGFAIMEGAAAVIDPCFSPAISTGYLEDALVEYTSKRRRLDDHDQHHFFHFQFPQTSYDYWNNQIDDINNDYYYYYNYHAISTGGFFLTPLYYSSLSLFYNLQMFELELN